MTATTTSQPLARPLSLIPLMCITLVVIGAATYWQWPQPARDRVIRMLGGVPAGGGAADAVARSGGGAGDGGHTGDHDHGDDHGDDHDGHTHGDTHGDEHDHEGHVEENSLELSEQARRSIGLREGDSALTTFHRTISVPGIVVERRGRSRQSPQTNRSSRCD